MLVCLLVVMLQAVWMVTVDYQSTNTGLLPCGSQ